MRRLFSIFFTALLLVGFMSSCSDDDDKDKWKDIVISNYQLPAEYEWMIPQFNTLYRIDSEEDFRKYVININTESLTGGSAVNFLDHTLLVVQGVSNNGIESITKKLIENGNYKFSITIKQNDSEVIELWTVAVLAPKLTTGKTVSLNINCPSCQKDSDNKEITISDYELKEGEWVIPQFNTLYRVDSEEDFRRYAMSIHLESSIFGSGIDFEKQTMLIVQLNSPTGIQSVKNTLVEEPNKYNMKIFVKQYNTTVVDTRVIACVVPKLLSDKEIILNVDYEIFVSPE